MKKNNSLPYIMAIVFVLSVVCGFLLAGEKVNAVLPKEKVNKSFVINGGIFDLETTVIITEDTTAALKYIRANLDSTITGNDLNVRGVLISNDVYSTNILYLPNVPTTNEDFGVVSHEILHLVRNTMLWANVPLTDSSEEAWAFLMHYYTKQFYDNLNKK